MEILPYDPGMRSDVASLYNRATASVPHCYSVDEAAFGASFMKLAEGREKHCRLGAQEVHVAKDAGAVVGFVHAAVAGFRDDQEDQGVIRFLWYERGKRKAGQALLEAAGDLFRRHGVARAQAFYPKCTYPFYYLESAFLSDRLDHVQALLAVNGYRRTKGEIFLDWPDLEPREPPSTEVNAAIDVERTERAGRRPDVKVVARLGGDIVGVCNNGSGALRTGHPAADEWFFTHWLGVEDEYQGRGLGRHLLQRALNDAHELGYRNAVISTSWDNHRAFLFYANYGYHVVDWTHGYTRGFEEDSSVRQG